MCIRDSIKVDAKTKEPLANAKFKITKTEDDTVSEYMTDENGKITIQEMCIRDRESPWMKYWTKSFAFCFERS